MSGGIVRVPRRIQRRRTKGWRMPPGALYVGRPGPWGNPMASYEKFAAAIHDPSWCHFDCERHAIIWQRKHIERLRGLDLACWCHLCPEHADGLPLGVKCDACTPCHADVQLELANS